jgi:MFS transporter, DHA1 family, multidrug resistance protein
MALESFAPHPDDSVKSPLLSINSVSGESSQDGAVLEQQLLDKIRSDAFIVDWHGVDDAGNPQNLPSFRKVLISISLAMYALTTTFASSVFSAAAIVMAEEFGTTRQAMILGCTSIFMVGFAAGPTLFGFV